MLIHMKSCRLLLLAIVGATVVACGGPDDDDGARVATLHRGLSSDPESLDPHKARSVQAGDVLRDIGEGLTSYSTSGELVPALHRSGQFLRTALSTHLRFAQMQDGQMAMR